MSERSKHMGRASDRQGAARRWGGEAQPRLGAQAPRDK